MYIKHIYLLTQKKFFLETLERLLKYKIIHINSINECRIKVDILIFDSIDLASLTLVKPFSYFLPKKKYYIKYLIFIGEKYKEKTLYKNLNIQKEILISRPIDLIKLCRRIHSILYDYLPFLMIDDEYLFDYQNSCIFEIKSNLNNKINLTEKEMQIFQHMLFAEQHATSRHNIGKLIWNFEDCIQSNTIEIHITKLKQKLGKIITINQNEYYLNVKDIY